uniref:Uncharacterized protein n=1 Tax=Ceratitis capitata TaxID=7213 RepID=W8C1X7_CERCA
MLQTPAALNRQKCMERIKIRNSLAAPKTQEPNECDPQKPKSILARRTTAECPKNVSPEFEALLKPYKVPRGPLMPLKIIRHKPKCTESKEVEKSIDELDPAMARYMRTVMEQNSIQVSLYDIDFYGRLNKRGRYNRIMLCNEKRRALGRK